MTEEIAQIDWTVYGKIERIQRTPTSDKSDLEFEYTPDGHRSLKRVYYKNPGGSISHIDETYYIRDASGNMMATYTNKNQEFTWESSAIYGSSRLGVVETNKLLVDAGGNPPPASLPAGEVAFYRDTKRDELSNHPPAVGQALGNVLAVVSDKRTLVCINGTQHYEAEIIVASDYYPFGSPMAERSWSAGSGYRFGFNSMEMDNETYGQGNAYDFGARIYDSRLGRWLSIDPLQAKYSDLNPYHFVANSPLLFVDKDGRDLYVHGSNAEFLKFKAMIELEFDGLIEIRRDKYNKVSMHLDYNKVQKAGIDEIGSQAIMNTQMNKETYKSLDNAIIHSRSTNLELVEGLETEKVMSGNFRGATIYGYNGFRQTVDMEDLIEFDKAKDVKGVSMLMHEVEEAFQDQAVNGSPKVGSNAEWRAEFTPLHDGALALQAKINKVDEQQNLIVSPGQLGATTKEFWIVSGINNKSTGKITWSVSIFDATDNNMTLTGEYNNINVSKDSKTGKIDSIEPFTR